MIGLEGTKMSKSLGNLVFVHKLVEDGTDPSAIRLGVFASHYRADRDWSTEILHEANERLELWRKAFDSLDDNEENAADLEAAGVDSSERLVSELRACLAQDLDTPGALQVMDTWAHAVIAGKERAVASKINDALFALLGVRLAR